MLELEVSTSDTGKGSGEKRSGTHEHIWLIDSNAAPLVLEEVNCGVHCSSGVPLQ